jgi:hypothetical protein
VIAIMPHHWPQTEIETPLVRGLLG